MARRRAGYSREFLYDTPEEAAAAGARATRAKQRLLGTVVGGVAKITSRIIERAQGAEAQEVKKRGTIPPPTTKVTPPTPPPSTPTTVVPTSSTNKMIRKETTMPTRYSPGPSPYASGFTVNGGGRDPFQGGGGGDGGILGSIERGVDIAKEIKQLFGGGEGTPSRPGVGSSSTPTTGRGFQAESCPPGRIKVGSRCVDPSAALPGGEPFVTQAGGNAVQGAFGMPAVVPDVESRTVRQCPSGMVLGIDNLCYPKAILSRRSKYRKHRPGMKPLLTGGDRRAIRRAERVANKLKGEQKRLRQTKNALHKVL